jgi:prevent-host-death family protein
MYSQVATFVYMIGDTVGVRELRQNLSRYLDRARHGRRVVVTDRNRPIAVLAPLPENEDPLARLVAEGRVAPAERPLEAILDELRPVELDDPYAASKAVEETREEPDYGLRGGRRCSTSTPPRSSRRSSPSLSRAPFGPRSRGPASRPPSSSSRRSRARSRGCGSRTASAGRSIARVPACSGDSTSSS